MGSIYKRGNTWWLKYYRNGVPIRESADTDREKVAKDKLREREGDVARGIPVTRKTNRALFDELAGDVLTDYRVNGKRSLKNVTRSFKKHILPYFRGWRAAGITTADVRKYVEQRQAAGGKNSTINRELAAIKRAFSLGIEAGKVTLKPKIPMLREDNVRTGFFEREQFETVRAHLPEPLRPVVTFAFLTGWRVRSEVQPLQWRQIDFKAGTIRLDPGTTKNGDGRVFPMTVELRRLLEEQRAYTDAVQRKKGVICPWVFHRNGKRVLFFYKAWRNACAAAGCPGRILHDFRRTSVRGLVRAGIPERVCMQLTGHRTRQVFERYDIVSEADLTAAAERLNSLTGTIPGTVDTLDTDRPARTAAN